MMPMLDSEKKFEMFSLPVDNMGIPLLPPSSFSKLQPPFSKLQSKNRLQIAEKQLTL